MEWWKRAFGLHPVEMLVHFVAGGFLVAAFGEASGNDAIIFLAMSGVLLTYAWRRQKAITALPASGMHSGEVKLAELDAQADELHELRGRMVELEERLDFTERLLAQQREPEQLGRGQMNAPELIQILGVITVMALIAGLGFTGIRWLWKRTDRGPALPAGDLDELRSRIAELEGDRDRMAELEERLDFAERLLAQQREPEQLERPK